MSPPYPLVTQFWKEHVMSAHVSRIGRLAAVTSAAVVLACTGIGVGTASAAEQSHEVGYSAHGGGHGDGADGGDGHGGGWGNGGHGDGDDGGWGHGDGGDGGGDGGY
jgi:hypothetical protein